MAEAPRFYLIGTKYGRSEDVLRRMVLDGVISTGFVDTLDLSPIVGKAYPESLDWIKTQIPDESPAAKSTLARFATMRPGDLVALKAHSAPHGTQARLVIARYAVIAGDRKAIYARSDPLGHTIKVDFLADQEPIELPLGYGQTLHEIEDETRIGLIFGRYAHAARIAVAETAALHDKATHSSEVAARGAYVMQRTHNELQNELRKLLSIVQAQHFAPRSRPQRNAVSAGCCLQRYQHVIRIGETVRVSQIGHALFFDKMPLAGQQPQDARD